MHGINYRVRLAGIQIAKLITLIAGIAFSNVVTAQVPGHWELVYSAPHWVFTGMQFHDANHGVLLMDYGTSASLTTSDAGVSWLLTKDSGTILDPVDFHAMDMPTDSDVYVLSSVSSNYSSNGGITWKQYDLAIPPTLPPSSWKLFPNGTGRAVTYADQYMIWTCSDSARYFYDVQGKDWINYDSVRDAIIIDTNEFWVSNAAGEMIHTIDGGKKWNWVTILPTLDTLHSLAWITLTPNSSRLYVILDRGPVPLNREGQWDSTIKSPSLASDFIESTNRGYSWRVDSSLGSPRIYQLGSPGQGKLWAFVGKNPAFYLWYHFKPSLVWPSRDFYADSLLYSPDDGQHWFEDSTFLGDTLMQMCWPDSNHGYIAAERGNALLIYRFVPNPSVVMNSATHEVTEVLTPNPAIQTITIASGLPFGSVYLSDVLGREILLGKLDWQGRAKLDISHLTSGNYVVMIEKDGIVTLAGNLAVQ